MGYKPKRKTYRLVFEDADYAGLEVTMRSVSVEAMLGMAGLADKSRAGELDEAGVRSMFEGFAAALDSWNVEDDAGQPVPPTLAGVIGQDLDFVMAVFAAWFGAVSSVNPPSPAALNGGGTPLEASIPMEALSPSPGS